MEFGIARWIKAGNLVSGDAYLVWEDGPRALVALADGLGSGEKAGRSAQLAVQGAAENAEAALDHILAYCHYIILAAGGVGAMMSLLRLDDAAHTLEFAGVGNIRFLAHSRQVIQPITRYGYLGVRLPTLSVFRFPYDPGDLFILHTDGISSRFHLANHRADLAEGPQTFAERILKEYGKSHDDATVIVIRT
ncbi:MAG: PP2C family serine/threonine-protein phosphatase [Chloroflexia bacterium]